MITVQYKEYNDYELLYMVKENDETAYNLLYEKYKPLVISLAKKYSNVYINYGIDINDFMLEGFIGLDNSIKKFNEEDEYKFQGLVNTCISRQMQNLVKQSKLKKNYILNNSLYYESLYKNEGINLLEIKADENCINPEEIILETETISDLYNKFSDELKGLELEVFKLKFKGYSNKEIALKLNKSSKTINNAVTRIKKKYNK